MRELLEKMLAEHTGRTVEQVSNDIERDKILTAEQAVEYGLIDEVLESPQDSPPRGDRWLSRRTDADRRRPLSAHRQRRGRLPFNGARGRPQVASGYAVVRSCTPVTRSRGGPPRGTHR